MLYSLPKPGLPAVLGPREAENRDARCGGGVCKVNGVTVVAGDERDFPGTFGRAARPAWAGAGAICAAMDRPSGGRGSGSARAAGGTAAAAGPTGGVAVSRRAEWSDQRRAVGR